MKRFGTPRQRGNAQRSQAFEDVAAQKTDGYVGLLQLAATGCDWLRRSRAWQLSHGPYVSLSSGTSQMELFFFLFWWLSAFTLWFCGSVDLWFWSSRVKVKVQVKSK